MEIPFDDIWSTSSSSSSGSYSFTLSPGNSPKPLRKIDDLIKEEDTTTDKQQYPILEELIAPDPLLFCHASNITCVHEEDFHYASIIRMGLMIKNFDLILVSPTKASCKMAGLLGFMNVPKICMAEIRPRKDFQVLKVPNLVNYFSSQLYPNIDFSYLRKSNFLFIDDEESELEYLHRLKQFFYSEIPTEFKKLINNMRPSLLLVVDRETSRDIHYVGTRLDRL